jgi:plastocyanin
MLFVLLMEAVGLASGSIKGKVALEGKAIGPVIVYVKSVPGATPSTESESTMKQIDVAFKPGVLVVPQGATVHFPNLDKVWHNVFSLSTGNEFDLGLFRGGTSQSVQLKTPGVVQVFCNIHPQMAATILVTQNQLFTEVKPDGSYVLESVPPGTYELVAWEGTHASITREILVVEEQAATMDFSLKFNPDALNHLNKNNEIYGRYE